MDKNAIKKYAVWARRELIARVSQKAEQYGTGVYCGEYGVIDRCEPEDVLKWYKVISAVFNKYNIGRAAWSYKEMDFGLTDERLSPVFGELIKCL